MKKWFSKSVTLAIVLVMLFSAFSLAGCWEDAGDRDYGVKPADLNDPMPELWEEVLSGKAFDVSVLNETITEITIGADITDIDLSPLWKVKNLTNIYVEEGNPKFVSDNGVLYSKSYETLYKWPPAKKVTKVRNSVKYFAPYCFYACDMPNNFAIPDGTVTIGGGAFFRTNLTKLHIKKNVKTVGSWKYSETTMSKQSHRILPDSCKTVEISAPIVYSSFFRPTDENYSGETIIFKKGVRQIRTSGEKEREDCFHLRFIQKIVFPDTLEAIGDVSLPVNVAVANYTIPKSVAYLDQYAFDDYYVPIGQPPGPVSDIKESSFIIGMTANRIAPLASLIWYERKYETTFDCKSDYAQNYIDNRMIEWESNKGEPGYKRG